MDKSLVVVKEHLPQRCEICHQSDLFVAATGNCKRCKDCDTSTNFSSDRKNHRVLTLNEYLVIVISIKATICFLVGFWDSSPIVSCAMLIITVGNIIHKYKKYKAY